MEKLKEKKLYLMCGIPGSGKSYWIRENTSGNDVAVISRDEIRFSVLSDDDEYFSREHTVWRLYVTKAQEALDNPTIKDVVLDATHLNEASRKKILNALTINKEKVSICSIVMMTPLDVALMRNSKRKGRSYVPERAIRNMYDSFTLPKEDEGFDIIYRVAEKGVDENGEEDLAH
jgi:predicted kinase